MVDGMLTGMLIGSLISAPLVGGYYSPYACPYYARPYYCRPAWEPGWFGSGPPRPWWSYEGYQDDRGPPMETWPVVIFDVARSRACRRLDVRTAVDQFRHDVRTREARIRCDVWQPALRNGWASSRPSTHESCAAALVLFDAHDETSLEEAKQWCDRARVLTHSEIDDTRLFTLILVGCVYGDDDFDDANANAGIPKARAVATSPHSAATSGGGGASGSDAPVTHGEPVTRGEPAVVGAASEYARRKGIHFLETAVNTNEELHRLMVSLVQQVIGKLVARRRREQLIDGALKQLHEALEPEGFFKQPDADAIWRAVEQAKQVGVPESRLVEARKKLAEIEEKEKGGFLGLNHLGKFLPGCGTDRRSEKGRLSSVPGEEAPSARSKSSKSRVTAEGGTGRKADLI